MKINNKYYYLLYSDYTIIVDFIKAYSFNEKHQFIRKHFFSILGEQSGLEPTLLEISKEDLPEAFNYIYSVLGEFLKHKMKKVYYYDLWVDLFLILIEITKDLKEYPPNRYIIRLFQLKRKVIRYDLKHNISIKSLTEFIREFEFKKL